MQRFYCSLFCCLALFAEPLSATPQPDKVAKVASGELREAKVSWWGFNPEDSTEFLQTAINSKVPRLIVDKQASAWITGPLFLAGDQEIVFEEYVELLAKAGLFLGTNDSLLRASGTKNLKLTGLGKGVVLRMRKSDYHAEPYVKSQWRHGIALFGVDNVTIENLSIVSTGGDGVYLAPGRGPSRNVTIRNVICDDNNRQGISVISADKLLIEDCVLKNTRGTPPQAGIDFEPNRPSEQLTDCVVRRCVFENNASAGIWLSLGALSRSPTPISIRIEDCIIKGNGSYGLIFHANDTKENKLKGTCELIRCRFENCTSGAILINRKDVTSTLTMRDTVIVNSGKEERNNPIQLQAGDFIDFGGIDFGVVHLTDSYERPPLVVRDSFVHPKSVRGTLHLQRNEKTETIEIDDAWFVKEYPNVLRDIPVQDPPPEQFVPLEKANVDVDATLPAIWQRKEGIYWIYAEKGTPIRFALGIRKVGPGNIERRNAVLTLPNGKTMKVDIPIDKTDDFEFVLDNAPETGVYRLSVTASSNTTHHAMRMLRCNQMVVIPVVPRLDLFLTRGTLYLHVPPESKEFGVRFVGRSQMGLKASVIDPSGQTVWTEDNIVGAIQFDRTAHDGKIDGLWQIVLDRPSGRTFQDYSVTILGVPPLLGLNPKQLLIPRP